MHGFFHQGASGTSCGGCIETGTFAVCQVKNGKKVLGIFTAFLPNMAISIAYMGMYFFQKGVIMIPEGMMEVWLL